MSQDIPVPEEKRVETLHGLVLTETTATITVTSTGCTAKEDFELRLQESEPPILTITRVKPDLCRAAPHSIDIVFSLKEIGSANFTVANLFAPGPSLDSSTQTNLEGHWILKSGVGTQLLPNTKITAEFKDGKLSGSGGCNQYFTGYTVEPLDQTSGKIQIGKIGSTLRGCSEEIDAQESSYFQALEQVSEYSLTDEGLILPYPSPSRFLLFTRQ